MRLRWTRLALADFEHAHDYIAKDNPLAARQIAQRILKATERLLEHPEIGRICEDTGSCVWSVDKTPYSLIYAIRGDAIELWRVWHESRGPCQY